MRFRVKKYEGDYDFDPEEYRDFKMDFESGKLIKLLDAKKICEEKAKKVLMKVEEQCKDNLAEQRDQARMNKDVAVIVPTVWNHKPWLKACLTSLNKLDLYILLAYDNHFHQKQSVFQMFPSHKVMSLADSVGLKHRTHFNSVGISHMWNMWYNLKLLKGFGFPYVLSVAGDCILETPEGFPQLMEALGDNDIICNMWDDRRKYAGTLGVLSKTEVYLDYFEHFVRNQYDRSGSTEGRLYNFLTSGGYKVAPVHNSAHNFKMPDHNATWNKTIGYRHLHAEQMIRQESRYLPVEKKYIEFGDYAENIKKGGPLHRYYKTGQLEHLEDWWTWGR
jgi:hypothetical protein